MVVPLTGQLTSDPQDQNLGSWQLKRQAGTSPPIVFKFPGKFILKAGHSVTVSRPLGVHGRLLGVHGRPLTGCLSLSDLGLGGRPEPQPPH